MKIELHEDVAAPAETVFRRVADFARHERQALKRGAEVRRLDTQPGHGKGTAWDIAFAWRGSRREVRAEIVEWTPPRGFRIDAVSGGIDTVMAVEVRALAPTLSRIDVTIEMTARTMAARLLVQSLRLGHGVVTARLQARLADLAAEIAAEGARRA